MMKRTVILLLLLASTIPYVSGQYYNNENKVWAFGEAGGVDFTSGSPLPFLTSIHTSEGCASVSDASGHLLFYTDGDTVFTRTGTPMPNGKGIVPYLTYSSTQAALIVQVINNGAQYYIFSMEQYNGSIGYCHLAYSIADMTLNGGKGDIIASSKGIPINSNFSEKMISVKGNANDVWLLAHQLNAPTFFAYHITSAGISTTPVLSNAGSFKDYLAGVIKVSPNGKKIACQIDPYYSSTPHTNGTELYDFDANTGIVSNCQILDTVDEEYGAEFAPDNTKLFVHQEQAGTNGVYRYDISLATTDDIVASKVLVNGGGYYKDMKLGRDGKIYLPNFNNTGLDCITNPNGSGTSWGYLTNAVMLSTAAMCGIGLPNVVISQWTPEGIADPSKAEMTLSIFPNPAQNEVTISAQGVSGNTAVITCYNLFGAITAQKTAVVADGMVREEFDLSQLPRGLYEIRVVDDIGKGMMQKIVLN